MVATLARGAFLVMLGAAIAMATLQRAEPTPRLPLVHAGLSICSPLPGPDDGDDKDQPDGEISNSRKAPLQHGPAEQEPPSIA